jgi:hypothetical protein
MVKNSKRKKDMKSEIIDLNETIPINIEECKKHWDEIMNVSGCESSKSLVWKECEKHLTVINDKEYPLTLRTYFFLVKIPYFIGNFIIKNKKY